MTDRQINSISFALPTRQFEVNASVTVNETLPKVNEFVLRLIKVCVGLTAEEIAIYFGFSGKETRLVLEALQDQSLVRVEGDLVRLTEYAESKFSSDDDIPRFSNVQPRRDIIEFDLLSFHPINGRSHKGTGAYLVELPCSNDRIGSSGRLAEQAYQKHFRRILRDKEKTNDDIEIYKISSVTSKRMFEVPVTVSFLLSTQTEIVRMIDYEEDATEEFRLVVETAVSDALQTVETEQLRHLEEFVDHFDDVVIRKYLHKTNFDIESYIHDVVESTAVAYAGDTTPILGNLYMPDNHQMVIGEISSALTSLRSGVNLTSAVWLAPSYRFWGRTPLLDHFFTAVEKSLPQLQKPHKNAIAELIMLYPGLRETKWILERQLWSDPQKNIHFYSGEIMGGRIEVFIVPSAFACALFHYRLPGNSMALVPIGFMTTDITLIEKAKRLVGLATGYGSQYVGPAEYGKEKVLGRSNFLETFGFLNYCALDDRYKFPLFGVDLELAREHSNASREARQSGANSAGFPNSFADAKTQRPSQGKERSIAPQTPPKVTLIMEETEDQIVFRISGSDGISFKISKDKRWSGLPPIGLSNSREIISLAARTGVDRERINVAVKGISEYMRTMSPAECAKVLSAELDISVPEIWRFFIDSMFILGR